MNKSGSMTTLLVVALLALGVMAFMTFESDTTGAFAGPRGPGPIGPGPIGPGSFGPGQGGQQSSGQQSSSYAINQQPQTTGSDVSQIQLECYIWKYDHPGVQAPVEIAGLCASFGVTV